MINQTSYGNSNEERKQFYDGKNKDLKAKSVLLERLIVKRLGF